MNYQASPKIVNRPLDAIRPYDRNPRRNEDAIAGVVESIRRFGFRQPLVVDENGVIVCGHTRYEAAKRLGFQELPCVDAADLNPDDVKAYRILDNKLQERASWDPIKLADELDELAKFNFDFKPFDVDFEPFLQLEREKPDDDARQRDPHDDDVDADLKSSYEILVKLDDETSQRELYERLRDEGYDVRLCNF